AFFLIDQNEVLGVDHVIRAPIAFGLDHAIGFAGEIVNFLFGPGQQVPFTGNDPVLFCITLELGHGINLWGDRKGGQFHLIVTAGGLLDLLHGVGQDRAKGGAGGIEKIGDIDFVLIVGLGDGIAVLIDQFEIGYGVVFPHILY